MGSPFLQEQKRGYETKQGKKLVEQLAALERGAEKESGIIALGSGVGIRYRLQQEQSWSPGFTPGY